ncbi:MAG: glycosyltransferase [Caulobacteraceae bacterium]|nr:glycosyltransferase [Caulobacteraceae bacterium]
MKFTIKTFGWRNQTLDQISRIDQGLKSLGCSFVEESPDIVYSNNDMYDDILEYANNQKKKPFIILNVLDLQIGNPKYNLAKVKEQLSQADAITCISKTVKNQISEVLNLDAEVIYNPIKDINYDPRVGKSIPFLYVGRANDIRKRFSLIKETFKGYEAINQTLVVCGSENPNFGIYTGILADEDLDLLYNSCKFLLLPSSFEGLGLPMIEAMMAGSIPITCSDNPTAVELSPSEFICDPNPKSFMAKLVEISKNYSKFQKISLEYAEKYKILMNKNTVAQNIINIYKRNKA